MQKVHAQKIIDEVKEKGAGVLPEHNLQLLFLGGDQFTWTNNRNNKNGTNRISEEEVLKKLKRYKDETEDQWKFGDAAVSEVIDDEHTSDEKPARKVAPALPVKDTFSIWKTVLDEKGKPARNEDGSLSEELVETYEGTIPDGYVKLERLQREMDPQPTLRLRRGSDVSKRCLVRIDPGGWKQAPTPKLEKSELYQVA